jgi:hypothetical protein
VIGNTKPIKQDQILTKENYGMFALFFFSAAIVYFGPHIIQQVYFLLGIGAFYRSSKNYFWIAFVFLLMTAPAGFFSGDLASDTQRLPIYSFGKGFSFSFFDLFYIIAIVKAILKGRPGSRYYFNSSLIILMSFGLILMVYSLLVGMDVSDILLTGRNMLLPILFFILAPRLITNFNEFIKLIKVLLPFVFLSFIGQVYEISFGRYLIAIVKSGESTIASSGVAIAEGSTEVARIFDAYLLNIFSIIFCCFFLVRRDRNFNPVYLIIIIFLNFVICFTSATRGTFLTFILILATVLWFILRSSARSKNYIKYVFIGLIVVIVGLQMVKTSEVLTTQIQRSAHRIGTLGSVFGGDLSTVNARVNMRIPRLMKKFNESPVIGWGFSSEGLLSSDGHVGFHNMLREGGILEMMVFLYFFFQIMVFPVKLSKVRGILPHEKNSLKFMSISFLSLMIMHATSSQLFGYFIGFSAIEKWFMISLLLAGFNVYYQQIKSDIGERLKRINPL